MRMAVSIGSVLLVLLLVLGIGWYVFRRRLMPQPNGKLLPSGARPGARMGDPDPDNLGGLAGANPPALADSSTAMMYSAPNQNSGFVPPQIFPQSDASMIPPGSRTFPLANGNDGFAPSRNTFTAYTSSDGITWIALAGSSVTITMTDPVLAGLAVTSHNSTALGTVVFDTVAIGQASTCPVNWNCADIGAPATTGGQSVNGTTWTVQGAGGDIWGTSDQFHYLWQGLTTDGSVSAQVTSQTNTSPWAKTGVMIRQSTDPGSAFYAALVTPGNGILVQYRATMGAASATAASISSTVPQYLKIRKSRQYF
jgi:hypothetical protein